jgi:hypothetical protein
MTDFVSTDLAALLSLYDETDTLWTDPHVLSRPSPNAWSAGEHLHHAEMVNRGVIGAIRRVQAGRGAPEPVAEAALAFLDSGEIGRPRKAPGMVHPPLDLTAEAAAELRQSNRDRLAQLDPADVSQAEATVPHPLLGPLRPRDWVRFALIHTRHHHRLARVALAAAQ